VNLILSIVLVQHIGVAGVYVGTVVSGILANIIRPVIIYRVCFDKKAWSYFNDAAKYLVVILAVAAVLVPIRHLVMPRTTIVTFALMVVIVTVIYNAVFFFVFHRTDEFAYLWEVAVRRIPALRKVDLRR
jgi:hypothetical protein